MNIAIKLLTFVALEVSNIVFICIVLELLLGSGFAVAELLRSHSYLGIVIMFAALSIIMLGFFIVLAEDRDL